MAITALLLASALGAAPDGCPAPGEIEPLIRQYLETVYWSQAERDNWQVSAVGNFEFSPAKPGKPVQKRLLPDQPATLACPVRLTVGYTITHIDGRLEAMGGTPRTYWFYRDGFGDWAVHPE